MVGPRLVQSLLSNPWFWSGAEACGLTCGSCQELWFWPFSSGKWNANPSRSQFADEVDRGGGRAVGRKRKGQGGGLPCRIVHLHRTLGGGPQRRHPGNLQ